MRMSDVSGLAENHSTVEYETSIARVIEDGYDLLSIAYRNERWRPEPPIVPTLLRLLKVLCRPSEYVRSTLLIEDFRNCSCARLMTAVIAIDSLVATGHRNGGTELLREEREELRALSIQIERDVEAALALSFTDAMP